MTRQCQCNGCVAFTALDSVSRQSVAVDESSIDAVSRPYEYVERLRNAQAGLCGCGKCERSANVIEAARAIDDAARRALIGAGWPCTVREIDPLEVVIERGPDGVRRVSR